MHLDTVVFQIHLRWTIRHVPVNQIDAYLEVIISIEPFTFGVKPYPTVFYSLAVPDDFIYFILVNLVWLIVLAFTVVHFNWKKTVYKKSLKYGELTLSQTRTKRPLRFVGPWPGSWHKKFIQKLGNKTHQEKAC